MPHDVTVDLDSFTISSYLDRNFALTASTTLLLSFSGQTPHSPTAAELHDQVKAGPLWITRAASCHVELDIGLTDSLGPGVREQLQRSIVDAFEIFPAWKLLGLSLTREYNCFNDIRGARSLYPYSVHHDQQNAGLIAPDQVSCASVSVLSCSFTYGARSTPTLPSDHVGDSPQRSARLTRSKDGSTRHRKSKIMTFRVPPRELRAVLGVPEIYSLQQEGQAKRLEQLTHTALHSIIGSRKRFSAFLISKKAGLPTRLDIAPAVWNSHYFQEVVSRVQMSPLISSALCALISTGSPGLRRNIQNLGENLEQKLHQQMLVLILRSVRMLIKPHNQKASLRTSGPKLSPQLNSLQDFIIDDEQTSDREEVGQRDETPGSLWEVHEAPRPSNTMSSTDYGHDFYDDAAEMAEDDDWNKRVLDEGPSTASELSFFAPYRPSSSLEPTLFQRSAGLIGNSMLDLEDVPQPYTRGPPSDGAISPFVEDMDNDDLESDSIGSFEDSAAWEYLGSDSRDSVELDSDLGSDIETFGDEYGCGIWNDDVTLQLEHALCPEDLDEYDVEDVNMHSMGENNDEWAYGYVEQAPLYEIDAQSNEDELMRETWSDSSWNDGNGFPYSDDYDGSGKISGEVELLHSTPPRYSYVGENN